MDLFCPHCTQRVTIPDDQGGQVTNCPLCAKQFQAPSLAPPPAAPAAPPAPASSGPAPSDSYGMGPAPLPLPPAAAPPAPPSSQPAAAPAPPPPPGEYTRSCSCELTGDWLAFVPTACIFLIFILSFFSWHYQVPNPNADSTPSLSLWGLSFTEKGAANFLAYTILMFLCFPLSILVVLFDKNVIVTPPQVIAVMPFKNLVLGLLLGLGFLMLCIDYFIGNLSATIPVNPITVPLKLAIRLHFLAMAASFVMFWLNWRKRYNLPAPKCDAHW